MVRWRRSLEALPIALLLLACPAVASPTTPPGERLTFLVLWSRIRDHSPALRAALQARDAARVGWQRSRRHWLPSLGLDGRVFLTDDPAASFIGVLDQRSLATSDLSPDRLNYPTAGWYEQVALAVDWPFYQGGAPTAGARVAEQQARQKALDATSAEIAQYSEAVRLYASLLLLDETMDDWRALQALTSDVVAHYQVGTPENPVGYSGLLALKALRNRADIALAQDAAASEAAQEALSQLAGTTAPWHPDPQPFEEFLHANFPAATGRPTASPQVQSLEAAARGAAGQIEVAKAGWLPQLGLFAQVPVYAGSRAIAIAWTGGAYLRWSLFAPSQLDATAQASLESEAAGSRAEAEKVKEDVEVAQARLSLGALESSLPLLAQNTKLLAEQTEVAQKLFLSGAINALQLADALNRRADLLTTRTEVRLKYLEVLVTLAERSNYPVPGVDHDR